ncbi:MAG: DNA/RNA nuclease SfsA [Gammaproteobacteria bacterium]|nr:MAG: DNA/RNA nuclease SfsA [Gammaproteobacteria bacterium]
MRFARPLVEGILLRRYRRFLADVQLADGREVTAHVPNTGAMAGVSTPGCRVWLSEATQSHRKTAYTWELSTSDEGTLVAVNTGLANRLAAESIEMGLLPSLHGFGQVHQEVRLDNGSSRIDMVLHGEQGRCWAEVKSVTLARHGVALFPDAVTLRGQKHLRELMALSRKGERAAMIFCIQRNDVRAFFPAESIDPDYAHLLRGAARAGVQIHSFRNEVTTAGVTPEAPVPVSLETPP